MSDLVKAIEQLKRGVASLEFHHRALKSSADDAIERLRVKWSKSRNKSIDSFSEQMTKLKEVESLRSYEQSMKAELRGAVEVGSVHDIDLDACRRLAEALDGGLWCPEPYQFIFDARIELEKLLCKVDPVSDDGSANVATVRQKFLRVLKLKQSQNERADEITKQVTAEQWQEFSSERKIKKDKRAYFYKLILECDGDRPPKWLGNLK